MKKKKEEEEEKKREIGEEVEKKTIWFSTSKGLHQINRLARVAENFSDLKHRLNFYITFKINYIVTIQYMPPQIANSKISLPVEKSPMQLINCENLCATL